jgi:Fic family protein
MKMGMTAKGEKAIFMFKPKYKYSDQMISLLTRIAAAREVILGSPLIPRWEISLRREAIVRSAHSSTSIEGNNLSLEQVSDLAAGRKIMAQRKDKEEVINYIQVLEKLDALSTNGKAWPSVLTPCANALCV